MTQPETVSAAAPFPHIIKLPRAAREWAMGVSLFTSVIVAMACWLYVLANIVIKSLVWMFS